MVSARKDKDAQPNPVAGVDEAHWLDLHRAELQVYAGKWLAISGHAVAGVGADPKTAMELAMQRGARDPLLYFVGDPLVKSRARIA